MKTSNSVPIFITIGGLLTSAGIFIARCIIYNKKKKTSNSVINCDNKVEVITDEIKVGIDKISDTINSIPFPSMEDAISAKKQMVSIINKYGFTTVSELYETASLTAPYTSNYYAWTKSNINDIMNADIVDVNGHCCIHLPKPAYFAIPITIE